MSKWMASRIAGIGPSWLERRRLGFRNPLGTCDYIHEQIYSSIFPCEWWDHTVNNANSSVHGGVFSLEFSPEGSLLVAACERRSVLVFDPLTYKEIHTVENAHDGCVNCVKFLDSRSFATCSDDFTVALWDARNLSQKVRTFKGHTNWVKNIEYCPQDGLLVTSGFDGNILTWEMNKYREGGMVYNKVFATNGLMRTCLTPDASKMIICTTSGYLIVIHNLDLNTLTQDLDGFKPNMYRLMQLSQTILPIASDFTHLFRGHGKRNRVEFITDFPKGDDAEVVSSLQVHPDGHSAISRNVSNGEQSEWSCIHNIEERLSSDESDCSDVEDSDSEGYKTMNWPGSSTSISTAPSYIIQHTHVQNDSSRSRSDEGTSTEQRDLSVSPADVWEALVAIQEARIRRERDRTMPELPVRQMFRRQAADAGIQVRPIHSGPDSRIFVARPIPNSNFAEGQERGTQRMENTNNSQVPRRNVSINTIEVSLPNNDAGHSGAVPRPQSRINPRNRRKLPPRQRYCSLYRRSLVGQYDRTSIIRRPIYRPRLANMKFRRFSTSTKLHTNYEMNETQRLQIELHNSHCPGVNLNPVTNERQREVASGSGVRTHEASRLVLRRTINSALRNSLPNTVRRASSATPPTQTVDSTVDSIFNTFRVIENNVNSIRETVNTFVGRINSTFQVLRRSLNLRLSVNDSNETENNNNNDNSSENVPGGELATESVDHGDSARDEVLDHEEPAEESANTPPRETWLRSTWQTSESPRPSAQVEESMADVSSSTQAQPNSERTIMMGVFRAGSEDGVRGTSMRRHNVAAVTVSSTSQRSSESLMDGLSRTRNSNRSNNNNNNSNGSTKHYPAVPVNRKIHQNIKRLTHYIEEPNLGSGFIKELCVSPDGRVICSPFGNGIRLLSFSPTVQNLSHCYPHAGPIPLHELSLNMAHTNTVVSTKFSPFHNLLVSGCLSGKIVYYQPVL